MESVDPEEAAPRINLLQQQIEMERMERVVVGVLPEPLLMTLIMVQLVKQLVDQVATE